MTDPLHDISSDMPHHLPDDGYLWDGSGKPDPLVASLERDLAPLKLKTTTPAPHRPIPISSAPPLAPRPTPQTASRLPGALVAAILMILASVWAARLSSPGRTAPLSPTPLAQASASVTTWRVWRSSQGGGKSSRPAQPRETFTAGDQEYIALECVRGEDTLAWITLKSGSSATLTETANQIGATLSAGAAEALVRTPEVTLNLQAAGVTVSLTRGRVSVDLAANQIRVTEGVATARGSVRIARIPAEFTCHLVDRQPGLPVREDASKPFRYAATILEDTRGGLKGMFVVLSSAREVDAATLWNAAYRREDDMRKTILAKLNELVPAPDAKTLEAAYALDAAAMDAWWEKIMANPVQP